jgi:hypothetical protein
MEEDDRGWMVMGRERDVEGRDGGSFVWRVDVCMCGRAKVKR